MERILQKFSGGNADMKRKTKKVLVATGIIASAAAALACVSNAITNGLVREALDRTEPKSMKKTKSRMMNSFSESENAKLLSEASRKLEETVTETVTITSFDDTELTGHMYRAENTKRFIVAMHGWRSSWSSDFGMIAPFWHDNGCSVLYVEQRGQGNSGGDYMGFGMVERFDCLEWVKWLNANGAEGYPIYLAGISMGASTVLMASGCEELPENVHGIMADCGFTSAKEIWKHVAEKKLRLSYGLRKRQVDALCRARIDMDADSYSTLDAMKTNKIPVMFVHGASDGFVPVEMTYENYEACTAPKKILISEGADHGMSYLLSRDEYEKTVKEFWEECDNTAPEPKN